jgi:transcriptional regulator with XRE-family HTH domain
VLNCVQFAVVNKKEEDVLLAIQRRMGLRLTQLRKAKGYTSYETFAYDYEIPRMQYWRIEKGKANITLKSLMKLLFIHKVSVEDFFATLPKETKSK